MFASLCNITVAGSALWSGSESALAYILDKHAGALHHIDEPLVLTPCLLPLYAKPLNDTCITRRG